MESKGTEEKLLNESLQYMEMLSVYRRGLSLAETLEPEKVWAENASVFMEECGGNGCILVVKDRGRFDIKHIKGEVNLRYYEKEMKEGGKGGKFEVMENGRVLRVRVGDERHPVGFVLLFRKKGGFTEKEISRARILEKFAAVSIKNALSFLRYQEENLKTSLRIYTPLFFSEYIEKEISKARRYGRKFSLVFMKIDNYPALLKNFPREVIEDNLDEVLRMVSKMVRSADVFSKLGDDEFLILFPETGYTGSLFARARIDKLLENRFHLLEGRKAIPVNVVTSSACYPHDGLSFGALLDVLKSKVQFYRTDTYSLLKDTELPFLLDTVSKNEERIRRDVERFNAIFTSVSTRVSEFRRFVSTLFEEMKLRKDLEKPLVLCGSDDTEFRTFFEKGKEEVFGRGVLFHIVEAEDFRFTLFAYLEKARGYVFIGNFYENEVSGFHTDSLLFVESIMKKFLMREQLTFEGE